MAWMSHATIPELSIDVLATDVDEEASERVRRATYNPSSLRELPQAWVLSYFERSDTLYKVRDELQNMVRFARQDVRTDYPQEMFDIIFCRNLVLTYFEQPLQAKVLAEIIARLRVGGFLVIGLHEQLPCSVTELEPWAGARCTFRRTF